MRNCTSWPKGLWALWTKSDFYKIYIFLGEVKISEKKCPSPRSLLYLLGKLPYLMSEDFTAEIGWPEICEITARVRQVFGLGFGENHLAFRCDVAELPLGTPSSRTPIKSCSTKKGCLPYEKSTIPAPDWWKGDIPSLLLQDLQDNSIWAAFGGNWPC